MARHRLALINWRTVGTEIITVTAFFVPMILFVWIMRLSVSPMNFVVMGAVYLFIRAVQALLNRRYDREFQNERTNRRNIY